MPCVQLPFDFCAVPSCRRQAICQALRPTAHLFWLGEALLDHPSSMTGLQGIGQSVEVPQRQGRYVRSYCESAGAVRTSQLEGAQALQSPSERGVLAHALTKPQ
jgi:hypothetical protein